MANHLISFLLQSVDALHLSTPAVANHFISTVICFNFLERVTLVSPYSSRQIHVPLFTRNSQQLPLSTPYCSKKKTSFLSKHSFYTIPLSRNTPSSTNAFLHHTPLKKYSSLNKCPFLQHIPLSQHPFLHCIPLSIP